MTTPSKLCMTASPAFVRLYFYCSVRDQGSRASAPESRVTNAGLAAADALERAALVHGNMVGLVALDRVPRIVLAGVAGIAFVRRVLGMHLHDPSADPSEFGRAHV